MKQFKKDKLEVKIFQSREEMGETAASESAETFEWERRD